MNRYAELYVILASTAHSTVNDNEGVDLLTRDVLNIVFKKCNIKPIR